MHVDVHVSRPSKARVAAQPRSVGVWRGWSIFRPAYGELRSSVRLGGFTLLRSRGQYKVDTADIRKRDDVHDGDESGLAMAHEKCQRPEGCLPSTK